MRKLKYINAIWNKELSEKGKIKYSWKRVIIIGVLMTVLLRLFVFEKFKIYSVSMLPTMQSGEWDFVTKYNYGYSRHSFPFQTPLPAGVRLFPSQPQLGDVIVFKSTRERERWPYVKRVVGLPGDRVEVRDGRLIINGKMAKREELGTFEYEDHHGRFYVFHLYEETLPNGLKHKIVELSDREVLDNVAEITVPDGYYYFVGDNRDQSEDSRGSLGLIPFENLIGKAQIRN